LQALLDTHGMTASDLARLLDVHRSTASKILSGDRSLTVEHIKVLSGRFRVSADLFLR
jgi:HTH-type transcriptional regulator/antitoxin HigA